uniref:Uncharacterized protein n=1 Tax=Pyrodinium bahamense TaxID=73915 RepID=A0A7S0FH79_9DINO
MEGWLQRHNEAGMMRWLWQSHFFRLEPGPHLLSFYASHIWQGCRRDGCYDLTHLVGARTRLRRDGLNVALALEFSNSLASAHSVLDDVEVVELRVPDGWDAARGWETQLLRCIGDTLLQACEQCRVYDGCADSAARILARVQVAAVEGRPHVDVNSLRRQEDGATPLMLAAQAGHERVCTHLLMVRADPSLCDAGGRSATDLAASAGHDKVVALLESVPAVARTSPSAHDPTGGAATEAAAAMGPGTAAVLLEGVPAAAEVCRRAQPVPQPTVLGVPQEAHAAGAEPL